MVKLLQPQNRDRPYDYGFDRVYMSETVRPLIYLEFGSRGVEAGLILIHGETRMGLDS